MGEFGDFGIFFEILVESLVLFTKEPYNFGRLGFVFVVVKEAGQNVFMLLTHRVSPCVRCELFTYKDDTDAFFR